MRFPEQCIDMNKDSVTEPIKDENSWEYVFL